ncbi:MAG: glycosyltransferase [Chitinispirillaceae bacterium]|nr:glycosyltransferase [Chitinispirillaceae bacterium]
MRILHLTRSFLPVTENWIYSQIAFNTSCQSSVLCQYRQNEEQFPHDAVYPAYRKRSLRAWFGLQLVRLRGSYSSTHALRTIRAVKPDILHAHFAPESCLHSAAIRGCGVPLVTTFYGLDISMLPRRARWRKRYARLFVDGAAFIVEGDFMAVRLAGLGCPPAKIHCIPIGVDIKSLRTLPRQKSNNAIRILFTGLGREKKGARYAADAFIAVAAKHPEVRFDLVGGGRYAAPVRDRLIKTGLIDKCSFHGMVPFTRYRELLSGADVVLAPSVTAASGDAEGGAPVTVIEAQAAGIPVAGTFHCDMPMVVKHGETGLLCPERDTAALSASLERLIVDSALRIKMGAAAAERAAQRHDIRKQVEKIRDVYRRCAAP